VVLICSQVSSAARRPRLDFCQVGGDTAGSPGDDGADAPPADQTGQRESDAEINGSVLSHLHLDSVGKNVGLPVLSMTASLCFPSGTRENLYDPSAPVSTRRESSSVTWAPTIGGHTRLIRSLRVVISKDNSGDNAVMLGNNKSWNTAELVPPPTESICL
jgi:hypothetical protein